MTYLTNIIKAAKSYLPKRKTPTTVVDSGVAALLTPLEEVVEILPELPMPEVAPLRIAMPAGPNAPKVLPLGRASQEISAKQVFTSRERQQ